MRIYIDNKKMICRMEYDKLFDIEDADKRMDSIVTSVVSSHFRPSCIPL